MSQQLRQAAADGDVAKVAAHLAQGADVNAPHNYSGRTALTEAAIAGHLDVAKLLLSHGADINWRDRAIGMTPLSWASDGGHLALVELFLKKGADPELGSTEFLITPMMWAAAKGHEAIVQRLLDGGAKVNAAASDGRTALSFAKIQNQVRVIEMLAKVGGSEILVPKPVKIAWPKVDATGKTCDHSTPETVLRGFICAMNRWEVHAAKLRKSKKPHNVIRQEILDSMQAVLDRFCTVKKRPYGRSGSHQIPPEYDPKDEYLIAVDVASATRVELTTRCARPSDHEYLYVALKKKGGWRLDSKMIRLLGGNWMKWNL